MKTNNQANWKTSTIWQAKKPLAMQYLTTVFRITFFGRKRLPDSLRNEKKRPG